jgi:hypothetical protein
MLVCGDGCCCRTEGKISRDEARLVSPLKGRGSEKFESISKTTIHYLACWLKEIVSKL